MSKAGVRSDWTMTERLAQLEALHTRDSQRHEILETRVARLETKIGGQREQLDLIRTLNSRLGEILNKLSQIERHLTNLHGCFYIV